MQLSSKMGASKSMQQMLVTLSHDLMESTWSKYMWHISLRLIRVALIPAVLCDRWKNSGVPSSSDWFDPPLLCPELLWCQVMPKQWWHWGAIALWGRSGGMCPLGRRELKLWLSVLLGRWGAGEERFTWLCFQMTSPGNISVKAFQEGSVC